MRKRLIRRLVRLYNENLDWEGRTDIPRALPSDFNRCCTATLLVLVFDEYPIFFPERKCPPRSSKCGCA